MDSSALTHAKNTRRLARKAISSYDRHKISLNQLISAILVAEDAYCKLNEDDARVYRRWSFATAPDVAKAFGIKPALEIVK